jgi:hypothetical protein
MFQIYPQSNNTLHIVITCCSIHREEYMDVQKYEFYFECWPEYLTSEGSEQVRYEKYISKKFMSKHPCIVLFIIWSRMINENPISRQVHTEWTSTMTYYFNLLYNWKLLIFPSLVKVIISHVRWLFMIITHLTTIGDNKHCGFMLFLQDNRAFFPSSGLTNSPRLFINDRRRVTNCVLRTSHWSPKYCGSSEVEEAKIRKTYKKA